MSQVRVILSAKQVAKVKHGLKVTIGVTAVTLVVTGFRFAGARMHAADLADRIRMQQNTLKNLREGIKNHPTPSAETNPGSTNSVARLQTEIERAAAAARCTVNEFQASPDHAPYLSVFTLDTNRPKWEQVPIHVTLKGTLASTLATVETLTKIGIPVEPDSIEIARQSISEQGASEVLLRLDFRALIHAGGKA